MNEHVQNYDTMYVYEILILPKEPNGLLRFY